MKLLIKLSLIILVRNDVVRVHSAFPVSFPIPFSVSRRAFRFSPYPSRVADLALIVFLLFVISLLMAICHVAAAISSHSLRFSS